MEIELKYDMTREISISDLIIAIEKIVGLKCDNKGQELMTAYYFDTTKYDLIKAGYAVRIRKESNQWIGTVKTSGKSENGLHKRDEHNCIIAEKLMDFSHINIELLKDIEVYSALKEIAKKKKLVQLFKSEIKRDKIIAEYKSTKIEIVFDRGAVISGQDESLINEIELELLSGNEKDLIELGSKLARLLALKPSDISKFGRGLNLVGYDEK